ncbi:LacI family DNA-binding transcriptional regulator [Cupriavidus taiwanensis]|uniref:Transcriptional regulator, LacI family n=1 Tax=Cupriavidus taiwanensis TaxID=164546 RepID=A0A375IB58_9BURK|nr:LacI family DNA-binding transcriptional regulator [Cupriavidus taiwanensis]SOY43165.1 Transcriptional regulator, LacI family [Cupriavidus taiwanensis]SOY45647.1 Transcriptional regulator, LacI family [Cupriavidus taiwanensis]SOY81092.1 Transcriptional regulator, LacI family [Cupriavidus taiwanensis]SOZ21935.1 Transcriptional regulator, LacI family [Cupriavidus taiwanensis]SOZ53403.1 Transcriptional regulator, LacI family [Cupriavidus taiwanensis]
MTNTNPPKSVTLHDVAREAGVSLITASRALSNPGMVSEKTIARVQQAVTATGYIPNLLAGGLKSKRSLMIAALVPNIAVAQFLPTVKALTDALDAAGYQLILGQTGYDHAREDALLGTMISRRPDGIVVTGLVHSQAARERLRRAGIPVVETWDLSDRPVDMTVGFSHVKVGSSIAGYFLGKGWRQLGIATGDDHRAAVRREGFVSTVGHDVPTVVVPAPSSLALGRQALARLLEQDPRIRAIYCSSDQLAQGVMVEALARGLRIPQDLAICGFGDADFAAHLNPSLTTVHVDGAAIGALAARLLLDRCQGKAVSQPVIDVGFRIIQRQST